MSDPFKFTTIAFAHREFLGPYDAEAILSLTKNIRGKVIDFGCGKGAVLKALHQDGIGIEHNPHFAEIAAEVNPGQEIWMRDAKGCLADLPRPNLIICLGASQTIGTPEEALTQFAELLPPGAHLLYGDGFWERTPSQDYLDFLGAKESEVPTLDEALKAGEPHHLTPVAHYISTPDDWDAFEDSYYQSVLDWCDKNPDDPEQEAFRERITNWRKGYLKWGRGTLGFLIVLYRKS